MEEGAHLAIRAVKPCPLVWALRRLRRVRCIDSPAMNRVLFGQCHRDNDGAYTEAAVTFLNATTL